MLSITALAAKYGKSRETVKAALQRGGVLLRPLDTALGRHEWSESELVEMQQLYLDEQLAIAPIAHRMGAGYKGVRAALLRSGVVLRKHNTVGLHQHSEETRRKLSEAKRGARNPNFGRPLSQKAKERLSQVNAGRRQSAEARAKMSRTRVERGLSKGALNPMANEAALRKWIASNNIRPNRAELQLQELLNLVCPNCYELNVRGDALILGGKIPDFVHVSARKIIELYGDYWHKGEDEAERIHYFERFNFRTLIIWERELKFPLDLKKRIEEFECSM